jgi:hypothetical protein
VAWGEEEEEEEEEDIKGAPLQLLNAFSKTIVSDAQEQLARL